ncbi:enoyl-CoA hydratase/isomerase family protein [Metabacillus sp. 84]|uniref:enoyl-CoA hydratase/isomerase family protein n=1 Tax=Metabacillus sp. 84 TaxID=3404705 RepID=UPI003CF873DB
MGEKVIITEAGNGIVEIRLNRPEKRNAVDFDVMTELEMFLHQYEHREDIRALVLTGDGEDAFCSGGDLSAFHGLKTERDAYGMLHRMGEILYRFAVFPAPVFALINGSSVGGGCELAMAADTRIAKAGVKMGFIQGTLSITTGWGGASLLMERVPSAAALEVFCSSRIYSAEECKAGGWINHIVPASKYREEGMKIIQQSLPDNPAVGRAYKGISVNKLMQSLLWERMEKEIKGCARLWEKEEHHLAVDRFFKKS